MRDELKDSDKKGGVPLSAEEKAALKWQALFGETRTKTGATHMYRGGTCDKGAVYSATEGMP